MMYWVEEILSRIGAGCLGGGLVGCLWSYVDHAQGIVVPWRVTLFVAMVVIGLVSVMFYLAIDERLENTDD